MIRVFASFFLVVGLILLVGCNRDNQNNPKKRSERVSKNIADRYVCPMHPQISSEKPGQQCSICGMNLVKVDEENEASKESFINLFPSGRSKVKLGEYRRQLIGIRTEKVIHRDIVEIISAPGQMAFDPELFTAQTEYVEALNQLERVKDSPLAEIKRSTQEMVHSAKTRLKVLGLSNSEINKLNKSRSVSRGLILGGGRQRLVYAEVFESELGKIKKGQKATVRGNFGRKDKIEGEVIAVDQLIDPRSRTAKIRVSIVDENIELPPQAFVSVDIAVPLGRHLSVLKSAVLNNGKESFVFKKTGEGEYQPIKVTASTQIQEFAILYTGVTEGDELVSKANFLLDSESRLKSVIEKYMNLSKENAPEHSRHNH